MEFFNNISRERFTAIAENYINDILEDRGNNNVEDLASAFSNAGFTKSEFFQILDKYYLNDFNWTPDTAEKVNTETGEGVFWKEYTEGEEEKEEIDIGDSDQAILETALTQIGIPYSWEASCDGDGGWIDLKIVDGERTTNRTAAEIYFSKEGKFIGTN